MECRIRSSQFFTDNFTVFTDLFSQPAIYRFAKAGHCISFTLSNLIQQQIMSIEPIYPNKPGNGKAFAGLILLAIGAVLLLQQITWFFIPDWLISAPTFFIVLGLYIGAKSNFKKPLPIIVIVIATLFLLDDIFPRLDFSRATWPVMLIGFGMWMVLGRRSKWNK